MVSNRASGVSEAEVLKQVAESSEELIELTRSLVKIPSVTGTEGAVQEEIASRFREAGLETDVWTPGEELLPYPSVTAGKTDFSGRPNVVGVLRGTGGGKSLLLNGHIDVVTPGDETLWKHAPFGAEVENGRIYGRGSTDMKGGVSAALIAMSAIRKAGIQLAGDVILESVISEENGGAGTMAAILRGYRADAAIVMEPTELAVAPAQGGAAIFRLTVTGRAAHSSMRYEGVSALEKFNVLWNALVALEKEKNQAFDHPLYAHLPNKIPINIGVVHTGLWASMVPEKLVAEGRYGIAHGEDTEEALRKLEKRVAEAAAADPWLRETPPKVEWLGVVFEPAEVPIDAPITRLVEGACETALGARPAVRGMPYGADMRLLVRQAGIPTVLFGPGDIRLAHFTDEFVEISQLVQSAKVLALAILRWCGPTGK